MSDTETSAVDTETAATSTRKTLALSLRILARELGDNVFDINTAAATLSIGRNGINAKLNALMRSGAVERVERGRYRISTCLSIDEIADALDASDGRRKSWTDERRAKASETRKVAAPRDARWRAWRSQALP